MIKKKNIDKPPNVSNRSMLIKNGIWHKFSKYAFKNFDRDRSSIDDYSYAP